MSQSNENLAISSRENQRESKSSRRVEFQNHLTAEEYAALMNDNIADLT
jgi:hypothetical protein